MRPNVPDDPWLTSGQTLSRPEGGPEVGRQGSLDEVSTALPKDRKVDSSFSFQMLNVYNRHLERKNLVSGNLGLYLSLGLLLPVLRLSPRER